MSARPGPCGGHRVTGVPTAIANNAMAGGNLSRSCYSGKDEIVLLSHEAHCRSCKRITENGALSQAQEADACAQIAVEIRTETIVFTFRNFHFLPIVLTL
jgi:hypothetical protein